MAAPTDPAHLDYAIELYLAGKPQSEILATVGISATTLHRERGRRGIPPRRDIALPVADIAAAYQSGESEYELSLRYGVSRAVIRKRLTDSGVTVRSMSDAGKVRASKMTPEQRAAQAAAAHTAARGREHTEAERRKGAATRERQGKVGSAGEQYLIDCLRDRGLAPVPQKAVGRYNVDIAVPPVAVEVLGGGWHLKKAIHVERTKRILNEGWHLLFVWNHEGDSALTAGAADYVFAFLQEVGGHPSTAGEYRVISGGGQLLAAGSADDDQFPLVPPPRGRFSGGA